MSAPISWWWPTVAGIATLIAFLAGPTYSIAVPAATAAVIAAALTLVDAVGRRREEVARRRRPVPTGPGGIRGAFTGGEPGREDIVLALDLLERKFSRPDLPARTGAELRELANQPEEGFREYVAERLDTLEGPS